MGHERVRKFFTEGTGRTKQSFRDECNIQTILKKYQQGLPIDTGSLQGEQFGDFTNMGDFTTAQRRIRVAQESFQALPSKIRSRFHNEPGELLDFMNDEENREEAQRMGLIPTPEPKREIVPSVPITQEKAGVSTPEKTET